MLWRALAHVEKGSYIDIGAQDPVIDSVSLAFHERGWRGIHVEPTPHYAELLRQQRPGDMVIQAAVCNGPGVLQFFEIPSTGISTGDASIAAQHRERGFDVHEIVVPCVTLAEIFAASTRSEIHWLKIDVEGLEHEVLSTWGASAARPWIVVVESTLPMTQIETHESWEAILVSYGYSPVYFDGLNRYYVSEGHPEIKGAFQSPPNVFDGFVLNGTSSAPFHNLIKQRYEESVSEAFAEVERQRQSVSSEIEGLNRSVAALETARGEQNQNWVRREQEFVTQLSVVQRRASDESAAQAQMHVERERELHRLQVDRENAFTQRLQAERDELRSVQQDWVKREQALSERASQVQERLESALLARTQREQEVAAQLLAIQEQAAREKGELARSQVDREQELFRQHAAREQVLNSHLEAEQKERRRLEQEIGRREKEYAEQIDQSRQALEALLREKVKREQEITAQLLESQRQTARERAELVRSHSEQEHALQLKHARRELVLVEQHQAVQEAARLQEQEWVRQEKALGKTIVDLQGETQTLQFNQQLEAQRHHAELNARVEEHNRLAAESASAAARLKSEILAEQQTSMRLRQSLAHVQESLAATQASLTWRMTAPLRRLAALGAPKSKANSGGVSVSLSEPDQSMNVAEESQSRKIQAASGESDIPVFSDDAVLPVPTLQASEGEVHHALMSSNLESNAINVRDASIESIMISFTQAVDPIAPAVASTLEELLAHHDQQFVRCAYQTLLGRTPDSEGLGYYLGRIRAGISKIRILAQIRFSAEGKAHAANLPGLDAAIRRYESGQLPLIGWLFRWSNGGEGNRASERNLRAIENQLRLMSDESNYRFKKLEGALTDLRNLVLENRTLGATASGSRHAAVENIPVTTSISPTVSDGAVQLSTRARTIYKQIKSSAERGA
ncbi:FkbM family methyltransferase [Paraburkholderia caffeinilytica]|uniref:FkbM family methyltransferase n=1 Tax=Paraburkholderia caffeinilytica TaxID=1761016 RepID=UPI003DA0B445